MKIKSGVFSFVVMAMLLMFAGSCKKNEATNDPTQSGTVTDIDGNVYNTVTIGTQVWMVENLKTTKYRDGHIISNIPDETEWTNLTSGAYCNYNNEAINSITDGRLYNWYAVSDIRNITPKGWHVPTDAEWTILIDFLGGIYKACGKLKESGTIHWKSPNEGADNESGFTALPGGYRTQSGFFLLYGAGGCWWSSTPINTDLVWYYNLPFHDNIIARNVFKKSNGLSVRCIKD